jgi:hypothetical protein
MILCAIKWYLLTQHTCSLATDVMPGTSLQHAELKLTVDPCKPSSPGRFFAVNEVKAMIAHILLNYDIKLPGDSKEVPAGKYFAASRSPAPGAEVLFRKRKVD